VIATSTTFFSLLIYYRPLDFDAYNPGDHDPQVSFQLSHNCNEEAATFLSKTWQRRILAFRTYWIEEANKHQERVNDRLVNWWDDYDVPKPEMASTLQGGNGARNATTCIDGICGAVIREDAGILR